LIVFLPDHVGTDSTTAPVLHSGTRQGDANQNDGNRRDNGWKDCGNPVERHERKAQFQQSAHHTGSQHSSVSDRSFDTIVNLLLNGNLINGQKGKGCAHDRENTSPNVHLAPHNLLSVGNGDLGDVDPRTDTRGNQGSGDRVLLKIDADEANGKLENDKRHRNQSTHHCERVLQAHNGSEEDGDWFICVYIA
jgi:hypothetical protein